METEKLELSDRDLLEVQQILADSDREAEKMGLLDEERKKHEVVEEALHQLAINGIKAYIYADIPTSSGMVGVPNVYQFNTLASCFEYDKDGIRTEQSKYDNCFFHSELWISLVENTIKFSSLSKKMGVVDLDPKDPTTHRRKMHFMDCYMTMCYQDAYDKITEILDNKE